MFEVFCLCMRRYIQFGITQVKFGTLQNTRNVLLKHSNAFYFGKGKSVLWLIIC